MVIKPLKIFLAFFLLANTFPAAGDEKNNPDFLIKQFPRQYHITHRVYLSENTLRYDNENSFLLLLGIPVPVNNEYHDVSNVTFNKGNIARLNQDGDIYLRIEKNRLVDDIVIEYDLTCYDITADFSKVDVVYPHSRAYDRFTVYESKFINPGHPRIKSIAEELRETSTDYLDYARRAFEKLQQLLKWTDQIPYESLDDIFKNRGADCYGLSSVYISILRNNGIPARYLTGGGFENGKFALHVWTEFYLENFGWIPVDPSMFLATGYGFGHMPREQILLNRGGTNRYESINGDIDINILQTLCYYNWFFDSSASGTFTYDFEITTEIIYEADKNAYYNSKDYVSRHVSEIINKINAARSDSNLKPLREMHELNTAAADILHQLLEGNTNLNVVAEFKKRGIKVYTVYFVRWAFTIAETDTADALLAICGATVYIKDINAVGIGYIYNEKRGMNDYYILFAGI